MSRPSLALNRCGDTRGAGSAPGLDVIGEVNVVVNDICVLHEYLVSQRAHLIGAAGGQHLTLDLLVGQLPAVHQDI